MSNLFTRPDWTDIAGKPMSDLQELIQTGASVGGFRPDPKIITMAPISVGQPWSVLDFGCGIGRNMAWMRRNTAWMLTGYDSKAMLDRAGEYDQAADGARPVRWCHDWSTLKGQVYDLIMAILVLQHVPPEELAVYLSDMRSMTRRLMVSGRRHNDHTDTSVWDLVQSSGWERVLLPEGDPDQGDGPEDHHTIIYRPTR